MTDEGSETYDRQMLAIDDRYIHTCINGRMGGCQGFFFLLS